MTGNIITGAVILVLLALAIGYIVRAKKKGVTCIGCPDAGKCAHAGNGGCCGCSGGECGSDAGKRQM